MPTETTKVQPPKRSRTLITAPPKALSKHTTIEAALAEALARFGVSLTPRASGRFERFDAPDKPKGNANGWYRIHSFHAASFGIWHLNLSETVTLYSACDPEAAAQARLDAIRERERHEQARRADEAKAKEVANRLWLQAGQAALTSPWLAHKRLPPFNLRRSGNVLLMPMYFECELVNLERIYPNGSKRTLPGGRVKGAASLIGHLAGAERVLIAEGWSTAAALHEAMSAPVVVARYADNLAPVARRLRQHLSMHIDVMICGDDDRHLPAKELSNKGRVAARHAALAINAKLLMPTFCAGCETCTDFADVRLCRLGGRHG